MPYPLVINLIIKNFTPYLLDNYIAYLQKVCNSGTIASEAIFLIETTLSFGLSMVIQYIIYVAMFVIMNVICFILSICAFLVLHGTVQNPEFIK